jgi:hypothetical protein
MFAATGTGNQFPVIGGPALGSNLFLSPLAEVSGLGSFRLQGETYFFARIRADAAVAVAVGAQKKVRCFVQDNPFTNAVYFNEQFDPLVPLLAEPIFRDGASSAFRERLFAMFRLDEKSPARDYGRKSGPGLPGVSDPPDGKPDIGARELN